METHVATALAWKHRVRLACGPVYFERQVLRQCFKHAVNNLLGREVLTVAELDAIAAALAARCPRRVRGEPGLKTVAWHDDLEGDFATQVIHNALAKHGYTMTHFREAERDPALLPVQTSGRFLVRIVYGARDTSGAWATHVIALDADRGLLLDSQSENYLPLTSSNFKRKTAPNASFPGTRVAAVYRVAATAHRTDSSGGRARRRRHRRRRGHAASNGELVSPLPQQPPLAVDAFVAAS